MSYLLKLLNEKDFKTRADKRTRLLQIAATRSIWTPYRKLLRHKYADQWRFITEHFDQILPVDIQSFFSSKMDPNLLYANEEWLSQITLTEPFFYAFVSNIV